MTWEEFMKGITILYAFGLKEKDDWELGIWHRALRDSVTAYEYENACINLAKNNLKFWENDNIPAQIIDVVKTTKEEAGKRAMKGRLLAEDQNRELAKRSAMASYKNEEDRLACIKKFKEMNAGIWKGTPTPSKTRNDSE